MDPAHVPALGNLALVLEAGGRVAEARGCASASWRCSRGRPSATSTSAAPRAGRGRVDDARRLFQRELSRQPEQPMVLAWLAQAQLRLGEADDAARTMARAVSASTTPTQREIYSAKLAALRAAGARL